ncbi:hypothetical protein IAT38_005565 [Cryptococcus sp. DSM 104549]
MRTDSNPYKRPPPPQLSPQQLEHIERFLLRMKSAKGDEKVQTVGTVVQDVEAGRAVEQQEDARDCTLEEIREGVEEKDASDKSNINPALNPAFFPPAVVHRLPSSYLQTPRPQPTAPTPLTIPSLASLSLSPPSASYIVPYPPAWTLPRARARDPAYAEWEQRERTMAYFGDVRGSARWVRTVPRDEGLEVVWGIAGAMEEDEE